MSDQRFDNVFDALEDDPSVAENLKIRSALMIELKRFIDTEGLTQSEAAEVFGVTQPRVSDLSRGKIDRFSIDTLVKMLTNAGKRITFSVSARAA